MAIGLVIVVARGSSIAVALTAILLMKLIQGLRRRKILLSIYLTVVVTVSFSLLPAQQSDFYLRLKTIASTDTEKTFSTVTDGRVVVPTLPSRVGDESQARSLYDSRCQPLVAGYNSVAIRRILYQEAIELFVHHPSDGVGATNFGKYSCAGEGAYPHSTVLQAFAELGVAGGGLFLSLIAISLSQLWRIQSSSPVVANEATLLLALLVFFTISDQIYGSYFMAATSFFLFGVTASFSLRSAPFIYSK